MKTAYLFLTLLAALPASAGTAFEPICQTDTLSNYVSYYGYADDYYGMNGCQMGSSGVGYGGFSFSSSASGPSGASALVSDSNITLTPDGNLGFDISFNGGDIVAPGSSVTYDIGYNIIDPPPIVGGDLSIDPSGDVSGTLSYCGGSAFLAFYDDSGNECGYISGDPYAPTLLITVNDTNPPISLSGNGDFAGGPYTEVGIFIQLTLTGDDGPASFNGADADPDTDTDTAPEPGSLWLLAPTLAFLVIFRQRLRLTGRAPTRA